MTRRSVALPSAFLLATAAAGGCNLIFGVTSGLPAASSSGSSSGGGTTTTSGSTGGASSSSGSGGTGGSVTPSVTVSPMTATQLAMTTVTFTATVTGTNPTVTWSVKEAGGGKVDPDTGAYTAPSTAGTFHVVAQSKADPSKTGEATVTVAQTAPAVTLVATGAVDTATGNGSQSHLAYAAGTGEWWLFHDPAGQSKLATRFSKDFGTWTDGESLALPQGHSGDGRDLSIAYRLIAGLDVIHVTQGFKNGGNLGRYHVRATATVGHVKLGTPRLINQGGDTPPDGASTVILPSGLVIDSTGWQGTPQTPPLMPCGNGDVDLYTSGMLDDGSASLDDMKFTAGSPKVLWCVNDHVDARQLLAVGDVAVHVCVDGYSSLVPQTLLVNARTAAGQWNPSDSMGGPVKPNFAFPTMVDFDLDDWTAAVFGGQVHVVRRLTSSGAFEHAVVSPTGIATPGGNVQAQASKLASGLVLAPYGDSLVLMALDANAGSNVVYSVYDGTSWSGWATLVSIGKSGSWLGGFTPETGAKPAIVWTQTAGSSYAIAGALLP